MSKEDRDRLEEFFRKNTENYHFEFRKADWKKLQGRLDEAERKGLIPGANGGNGRFGLNGAKYYLFAVLLIFMLGGAYWGWNYFDMSAAKENKEILAESDGSNTSVSGKQGSSPGELSDSESDIKQIDSGSSGESQHRRSSGEVPGKASGTEDLTRSSSSANSSSQDILSREGADGEADKNAASLRDRSGNSAVDSGASASFSKGNSKDPEGIQRDEKNAVTGRSTASPKTGGASENTGSPDDIFSPKEEVSETGERGRGNSLAMMFPFSLHAATWEPMFPEIERTEYKSESNELPVEKPRETMLRRLISVGFTVSPDFSTVGIGGYTRPGTRYGLLLDYHISQRVIVNAGAIMTHNIYTASGDEYNPPSGSWGTSKPMSADGECKIVDIPINIRYNVALRAKGNLFVSAGFSSYIMLKEKYDFYYQGYYGSQSGSSWESQEVTQHWMGLMNFSLGYEHFVADRWSVQVAPFFTVPITGIGWGNVDLYSLGAYFSLKYHWNRK